MELMRGREQLKSNGNTPSPKIIFFAKKTTLLYQARLKPHFRGFIAQEPEFQPEFQPELQPEQKRDFASLNFPDSMAQPIIFS